MPRLARLDAPGVLHHVIMGDVRAEIALAMHFLHERPPLQKAALLNSTVERTDKSYDMYSLKCPYCSKDAAPFLRTYFMGYFPGNRPSNCQHCSQSIKYNFNSYCLFGAMFLVLLFIIGIFIVPDLAFLEKDTSASLIQEVPNFDLINILVRFFEIALVFIVLYASYEILGKYFGIRMFNKRE